MKFYFWSSNQFFIQLYSSLPISNLLEKKKNAHISVRGVDESRGRQFRGARERIAPITWQVIAERSSRTVRTVVGATDGGASVQFTASPCPRECVSCVCVSE